MPLPGSRRLVRAVLLALVTATLLGAAVGATNGSTQHGQTAVTIPAPRIGDRGVYTLTLDPSYEPGPDGTRAPFPFLDFAWQPGDVVRMGDGHLHATDHVASHGWTYIESSAAFRKAFPQLAINMPTWIEQNETLLYERGTPKVLAHDGAWSQTTYVNQTAPAITPSSDGPLGLLPTPFQQTLRGTGTVRMYLDTGGVACLFANSLQNRTIHVGDAVEMATFCSLQGVLLTLGAWHYKATAIEAVAGIPALRLDPTDKPLDLGGAAMGFRIGSPSYWFADGVPYPVRVAWTTPGQATPSTVDLTGFEPGASQRGTPSISIEEAPAVQTADPKPWGLDETGTTMAFPMSEAYRTARDNLEDATLRDYLAAHPDAYMASVSSSITATRQGTSLHWSFTMSDGDTWLTVLVTRDPSMLPAAVPVLPVPVPGAPTSNTTVQFSGPYTAKADEPHTYPHPAQAPTRLPTLLSLQSRWQAYASPEYASLAPNVAGFQVRCYGTKDDDCANIYVSVVAGHQEATATQETLDPSSSPPSVRSSAATRVSILGLGENSTTMLLEARSEKQSQTSLAPVTPLGPGSSGAAPLHPATIAPWVPSPEQAAGVGVAAVAVGLLYYLWPFAKGGLGLFSRLRQPQVLAHPARQQLLQLIEAEPGIHFKEMARRTGLPNGSLVHHLDTLRRGGQVVARPSGGYTLYFLGAHVPAGSAEAASALKANGARRILEAVRQQPGLSSADVAARCGLQPSTVTYHVQRLQAAGLLTGLRDGRSVRLHPTEQVGVPA